MAARPFFIRIVAPLLVALVALTATQAAAADAPEAALSDLKALLQQSKFAEADSSARGLLAAWERAGAPDSSVARVIDVLTESTWQRGLTGGAESKQMAERAVALKEKAFGSDDPEVGISLQQLATLCAVGGDYATARPSFEHAVSIFEKRFGRDDVHVARCLTGLANVLGDMGDTPGALAAYDRVLSIREHTSGPESRDVGLVLYNIGSTNFDARNFAAARTAYERSLAIWEKLGDPNEPLLPHTLNGLGIDLSLMGDYAEAEAMIDRAVKLWEKKFGPDSPYVAKGLNSLGSVRYSRGDYASIRPLLERALAINEKTYGPEHPYVARCLSSLGTLALAMGDDAAARPLLERTLAIQRKEFGPEHVDVARTEMNLANALDGLGEPAAARELLEHALASDEKSLGPDNPDVALILENLGVVLENTGDYAAAREKHERSLAIREKVLGPDNPFVATSLSRLAGLVARTSDLAAARSFAERSLAIREKTLGSAHPDVVESLGRLARVEALQGSDGALDHALAAEATGRDHLRLTSRALSEHEALRYSTLHREGMNVALSLAARGLDGSARRRTLDALVRSRAIVLDEMAARHRAATEAANPEVAHDAAELEQARSRLANLLVRGLGDLEPAAYRKLLDDTRGEKEKAEHALADVSKDFVRESSRARLGLDEIMANLPAGAALVAFAEYDGIEPPQAKASAAKPASPGAPDPPAYLAFVLRSGNAEPTVADLGRADVVDSLVLQWKKEASRGLLRTDRSPSRSEAAYRSAGKALRRAAWDPFASALAGADRVFVVPDGSLNLVNFAALPQDEGGYLIEHGPLFHYLSAERDLVPGGDERRGTGLLAVGAPSFDATSPFASLRRGKKPSASGEAVQLASSVVYRGHPSDCGEFASATFASLPATGKEAHAIVRLWKEYEPGESTARGARELTGDAANETAIKSMAAGHSVLHLATHGFFLGGCDAAPASARGIGALKESSPHEADLSRRVVSENPLLLSGLVLAGANHRAAAGGDEDDGILTAEEIASLDLSGVSWAVLSACETGVGDIHAGEGVFGLRRAFQVAGAATLVMSLWSVDDEATRSWMQALYEGRLRDHLDTAQAARRASLEVIRERRARHESTHPFYWAAFVAAGDWR